MNNKAKQNIFLSLFCWKIKMSVSECFVWIMIKRQTKPQIRFLRRARHLSEGVPIDDYVEQKKAASDP